MSEACKLPELAIDAEGLIDSVNALIAQARVIASKENFGAVNWGQLGVADVEHRVSLIPPKYSYVVVVIEEAAPNCRLGEWIGENLDHDKYPRVEIQCEW